MKVKEFLNIAYKNFEYMEIDAYNLKNERIRRFFNRASIERAFVNPNLISFLDRDVKYIFYDKNKPMRINIGLGESFTLTLPFDNPSTRLLVAKNHKEAEKINSFIDDNRENGFLMVYSCSIDIVSPPSIWWLVYQWDD